MPGKDSKTQTTTNNAVKSSVLAAVQEVCDFVRTPTPTAWLEQAAENLPLLLIDHANCEKKAASTALSLMFRYVDKPALLAALSPLAREELRHFEQVLVQMRKRSVTYVHLSASGYAAALRGCVATQEPARLVETLLMCAVVEARSCERFYRLLGYLPDDLAAFYARLLESEARHYQLYIDLAERYTSQAYDLVLDRLLSKDAEAITLPASALRFHSGPIAVSAPG